MTWLRARPFAALPIGLLLLAALGVFALSQAGMAVRDERDLKYFAARHYWQLSFDSFSAACGAGLTTGRLDGDYTASGRWTLLTVGVCGALLQLGALAAALRRMPSFTAHPAPPTLLILGSFLAVGAACAALLLTAGRIFCPTVTLGESAYVALNSFASVGLTSDVPDAGTAMTQAFFGLIGALGWPFWILCVLWIGARRYVCLKQMATHTAGYALMLLVCSAAILAIERPRGSERPDAESPALSSQTIGVRVGRSLTQTICAATAGVATEPLGPGGLRDGSKAVLAVCALVGGMSRSPAGVLQWILVAGLLASLARTIFGLRDETPTAWATWRRAGLHAFGLTVVLVTVVTVGLLVIESVVADRYQRPGTLADALLESASAVGGANLSSGLTETVTSRNLASGLGLSVNLYEIGMIWIMLAMLAGRCLPLLVFARVAQSPPPPAD